MTPRRRPAAALAVLALLALTTAGCGQGGNVSTVDVVGTATASPTGSVVDGEVIFTIDGVPDVVATVASGLATPWGIDFLPDGRGVVTERDSGRVLLVTPPPVGGNGTTTEEEGKVVEVGQIPETAPGGEAGLLGVAVSPAFASDGLVYFYVCTDNDNRVVRARLDGDRLGPTEPILTGIPNGRIHDGGRLAFGPDGFLYVSTGETGDDQLARDRDTYAGKILRITADGQPAAGNPFGTAIWSWGHRNVEGLAFDEEGLLWASEFGDAKADELNRIVPGADYGWPVVEGKGGPAKYTQPELTWSTDEASPSGLAYAGGYLWMAALNGERLWRVKVADGQVSDPTAYFAGKKDAPGEYGRLRTVVRAPDGRLWLTTSNKDGRGTPGGGDDRILLIEP
ncbi:PQQ-dependent sugar dehydrogenase [Nocardioides daeguensis]|uniref:PQQ-dependent sugar dehydrogenase n=1 Tax=Nocardioides daeguensis TaxID=908359 RepID=A0ABP6WKB1_9ACTN|nr:PQQ-dependent sugar dehydrogenase [Nocardioides daeguensis]MBV6729106.1 PQQ-dependent sugar dehydrogenase [Nocardioides daeguensis]MCR1774890.1 PQQ-dependent sugar dehydrogenase [Nocardioides daeguensis]